MATLAQEAARFYECDHNWDEDSDGVTRCVHCRTPKPVCQHEVDCYNDDDEYVGWHCVKCGEPVSPPFAVVVDDIPY